jgi:hypothetical protein
MKIDLPRVRATPVPETLLSLILLFILLSCSLLARFVLLIYLFVGSRAHSDFSSPSGDTPLYYKHTVCVCVCMLIDFFLPIPVLLLGQTSDDERTNKRTNERRRREKREREKLNYNHSAAIYIY